MSSESNGRIYEDEDGNRRIRLMKGLAPTPRRLVYMLVGVLALFAVPDLARFTPLSMRAVFLGMTFGLAALGVNILLRHTREVSFGHAAFYGTAAYAMAVLSTHFNLTSGLLLLVLSVVVATLMAVVIGFLSLRHTDIYFALLTLAFGQLLYALAHGIEYFGGSDGLPVRPESTGGTVLLFGVKFDELYELMIYYLAAIIVLVSLLVLYRMIQSPYFRALDAIGQNRTRAQFIGIPVTRYMWGAFILSGVFAGLGGGLFALFQQYVQPTRVLFFLRSGDILFMAILGGFHTLLGPIVGGIVLEYLLTSTRFYTQYFNALTGVILLLVVYFFPEGIVGSLQEGSDVRAAAAEMANDPGQFASDMGTKVSNWLSGLRHTLIGGR